MAVHNLFSQQVWMDDNHRYWRKESDVRDVEYMSVSRFLKLLSEPFEDTIAYNRADEETRASWKAKGKAAADYGTNIHNALELYSKTGQILQENAHMESAIKSIISEYKDYHQAHDEVLLYNDEYRLAGTTDKICILSRCRDSEFDLSDFKTNISKGIQFHSDYKKRLYEPLSHLHDCNYTKYSLQLSLYAYFFEQLTARKCRRLFIHFIPPDDMTKHIKIPVMYLKNDVRLILEHYKHDVLNYLEPQIIQNEDIF